MAVKALLASALLLAPTGQTVQGQQRQAVRPVEGEVYVGGTFPLSKFPDSNRTVGAGLGVELRYNFRESPLDVGLSLGMTTAVHGYDLRNGDGSIQHSDLSQSNRTAFVALMADYNFRQGCNVNPFAGVGLGAGTHDLLNDVHYEGGEGGTAVFIPRIGVEFVRHVRLTLSSHLSKKGYHNLSLTLGVVFGGGKKK